MQRTIIWWSIGVIVVLFLVTYFLFDPSTSSFFPKCPFLMLTGLKCPGCGSQRAIHSLLSGDLAAAWHFNAMLVIFLPIVVAYGLAELMRNRWQRFYRILNNTWLALTILVVFVAWWILRNVFGF